MSKPFLHISDGTRIAAFICWQKAKSKLRSGGFALVKMYSLNLVESFTLLDITVKPIKHIWNGKCKYWFLS